MKVREIRYSATNTYLIEGERGKLLFDTGWAGTFPLFLKALGEIRVSLQDIDCILISHYHPDHMGIAQEIAEYGPVIAAADLQIPFIHAADRIFEKEKNPSFYPIKDEKVLTIDLKESRSFLKKLGIDGEIIETPGHSEDSISLLLDDGSFFVGDLNPFYELGLHKEDEIGRSWEKLLKKEPKVIYYGHAKTLRLEEQKDQHPRTSKKEEKEGPSKKDLYHLTDRIMKLIDKKTDLKKIQKKTGADPGFIEDVARMYLTHQNITVQGILDRIEIKGK